MITNPMPLKSNGSIVGYIGTNEYGEFFTRVEGHGWQALPVPCWYDIPSEAIPVLYDAVRDALSEVYDSNAGYL